MRRTQLTAARLSVILIWFVASIIGPCGQVIADDTGKLESVLQSQHNWARMRRDAMMCGPNILYLFLRLYGTPVEYEAIKERYIPSHPDGMSLIELRDACADFGLSVQVRQCSIPEMCKAFRSPVIAYTHSFTRDVGHYMIILAVESDSAYLMDGTTGRINKTNLFKDETYPRRLENVWRGYILVPSRRGGSSKFALGISMFLWLIATYVILRSTPRSRQVPHRKESKRPLACVASIDNVQQHRVQTADTIEREARE